MWLAIGALLLLALAVASAEPSPLTLMERDMLCLCRQFNDARLPKPADPDIACQSFHTRWESMFPGAELGIGVGGLRALAYKSKSNQEHVAFAFRDFLHDKPHFGMDDDYWQAYSMRISPSVSGGDDMLLPRAMMYFRYYFGFDYLRHAGQFVDEVLTRGGGGGVKRIPIFTGYGFGGSIAMIQALRVEHSFAVTFSAPSNVRELAADFWSTRPQSKRITNLVFAASSSLTRAFGEGQSGIECVISTGESEEGDMSVAQTVFSDTGFARALVPPSASSSSSSLRRVCKDP